MLTPAYSSTATERVLPRLALDFTTGTLDARVTISRALNTATRVNSSGLVEIVNANLPRFDYDPVTLAPKGLLIEEARTNIAAYSQQFDNAAWVKTNSSVTPNVAISPDGTVNADILVPTVTLGQHRLDYTSTSTAATHGFSVYAKAAGYGFVWLRIGTSGGVVSLTDGSVSNVSGGYTVTATNAGNGWWRVAAVGAAALISIVRINVLPTSTAADFAGDGTSGVYLWGAQLEAGAFATSYIPTTTTSVTRNADVVTMTGTNFSDWYNASEGAFVARFLSYIGASVNNPRILAVSDGSTANCLRSFLATTNTTTQVNSGGVSQASLSNTPSTLYGTFNKIAIGYKTDRFVTAINGGAVSFDLSGSVPVAPIRLNIGADFDAAAATQLNGYLSSLNYYPQCLTNAETQAFSK